jgi:uncharacterized protein YhbP (UPF0306 family)
MEQKQPTPDQGQIKELLKKLYQDAPIFNLSTSIGDQPWTCTLIFVWDEDLNMYWLSSADARHSKNIEQNPKVSATITMVESDGKGRMAQIEGVCTVVEDDQRRVEADQNFKVRHHMAGLMTIDEALEETKKLKLYQLKPTAIHLTHEPLFGRGKQEYTPQNG